MKKQHGFTMIELVMVIAILGTLAAFALPKFADLSGNAKTAAGNGAIAAVRSAAAVAHAYALATGTTSGDITMDNVTVTLVNGYPSGDNADTGTICTAADLQGFTCTDDNGATATTTVTLTGTSCTFTYREATSSVAPVISALSGCT